MLIDVGPMLRGEVSKIDIDYTVEIVGNLAEHTKMSFSVLPQSGLVS